MTADVKGKAREFLVSCGDEAFGLRKERAVLIRKAERMTEASDAMEGALRRAMESAEMESVDSELAKLLLDEAGALRARALLLAKRVKAGW
jgi:hypothetical protein